MHPTNIDYIVKSMCVLHNYLIDSKSTNIPNSHSSLSAAKQDSSMRSFTFKSPRFSTASQIIRNTFCDYFCNEGKRDWQEALIDKSSNNS